MVQKHFAQKKMELLQKYHIFWLLVLACAPIVIANHWDYNRQDRWPGSCNRGRFQSPINIEVSRTVYDRSRLRGQLQFSGYENVAMDVINNGHTVQWSVKSSRPMLRGGPLNSAYLLDNVHLHWTSEHNINRAQYWMEIHFVHVKQGLTLADGLKRSDGLCVIGVLVHVNDWNADHYAFQQLMPMMNSVMSKNSRPISAGTINLRRFMSKQTQYYYTYQGSLTTPDCNEAVIWIVMDQPITITQAQYNHMTRPDVGGRFNFRRLQPVNGVVYRSFPYAQRLQMDNKAGAHFVNPLFYSIFVPCACLKFIRELGNLLSNNSIV